MLKNGKILFRPFYLSLAFLKTDQELQKIVTKGTDSRNCMNESGSVALTAEVNRLLRTITVASLGDSKAIVVTKTGGYKEISVMHSPNIPSER